jgi:hypothetical protein
MVDVGLIFDLHVIAGAGNNSSERDRFFTSYRKASPAASETEVEGSAFGTTFSGLRFDGLTEFGPQCSREVYAAAAGDDLIVCSYSIDRAANPHEDEWRQHLLTLVADGVAEGRTM